MTSQQLSEVDEDKVQEIVVEIGVRFRTFGGGVARSDSFVGQVLKDTKLAFAAGVEVEEVVRFILGKVRAS